MSAEKEMGATQQVIPDEIQVLFGKPPLLYNENPAQYMRLLSKIAVELEPKNTIEWFWVKDVADLIFEIQRLRRFKAMMINYGRKAGLTHLFKIAVDEGQREPGAAYRKAEHLAHHFIAGDAKAKKDGAELLEKNGFDEESIKARAFHHYIQEIEITDRLLAATEIRRDKVLREIEFHRESLGRRMGEIVAAESDKALRLPGPKGPNDIRLPDAQPRPPEAKGA